MVNHIMITGGSGLGKTTLAKFIAEALEIEFVSSSYSDLIPSTRTIPHSDMIHAKSVPEIYEEDRQLLALRNKIYHVRKDKPFVTDRSYLDSAAFFIDKLSSRGLPSCEFEQMNHTCKQLLEEQCTHLIFIPAHKDFIEKWEMEDNKKRVTNKYYQFEISQLIFGILNLWEYKEVYTDRWNNDIGYIPNKMGTAGLKVMVMNTMDLDSRKEAVLNFIKYWVQ